MNLLYSKYQKENQARFSEFFQNEIAPYAKSIDQNEYIPASLIEKLGHNRYLGSFFSEEFNGLDLDKISFGLLNEQAGKACTSIRSLITVQSMVGGIIERWGTKQQKNKWLPKLSVGEIIASFALTEPEHGSDASSMEFCIKDEGDYFTLNGRKKWISFAQIADLFLVFGKLEDKICCLLVPPNSEGLQIKPIKGLTGARGCMLAEVEFKNCLVSKDNSIGNKGFGLFPVAFTGLDIGRYSIAWGCVGLAQQCLESAANYLSTRKQFGELLKNHQLLKRITTEMTVELKASRLLCYNAGIHFENKSKDTFAELLIAKYHASKMASKVSDQAVQVFGANGLSSDFLVERFWRDSKVMRIIEGFDEMLQLMIARYI